MQYRVLICTVGDRGENVVEGHMKAYDREHAATLRQQLRHGLDSFHRFEIEVNLPTRRGSVWVPVESLDSFVSDLKAAAE